LPRSADGSVDLHSVVSPIKNEDIVFIKQCTHDLTLHIKAIGVVKSDYPSDGEMGICLPVEWVWQGEKVPENLDEVPALCAEDLYEEHNIVVQREILDLLPEKFRLPQEW
jgi:hypothetical protein